MLTVDVDKRIDVDECLAHPWITLKTAPGPGISDSITTAMDKLDFSKRKIERERTLLATLNSVKVSKVIEWEDDKVPVKVFDKNPDGKRVHNKPANVKPNGNKQKEDAPAANKQAKVFMEMGGRGDEPLFGNDTGSRYEPDEVPN